MFKTRIMMCANMQDGEDLKATKQKTSVSKGAVTPKFDEKFVFYLPKNTPVDKSVRLQITVCPCWPYLSETITQTRSRYNRCCHCDRRRSGTMVACAQATVLEACRFRWPSSEGKNLLCVGVSVLTRAARRSRAGLRCWRRRTGVATTHPSPI
jgi:hypothetical protein